ncbi:hypothetical protein [Aliamphritea hakodatensis]|uniref:hypothetical protein n=1 Tax=Aliamphritea hakodatensis TaxID=2895352 RepID=UPI0022FDA7B7|nr:hypothetical protein [Aliamphritea hakodatensis]
MIINNVDFDSVLERIIASATLENGTAQEDVRRVIEYIGRDMFSDIAFLREKQQSGEYEEDDARTLMDEQKLIARLRLRNLPSLDISQANRLWTLVADEFSFAISRAIGWQVL